MGLTPRAVLLNAAVAVFTALTLAPLLWMLSVSLMQPGEASGALAPLLPSRPTLHHYRELFTDYRLGRPFLNSLLLASAATALSLLLTAPAGYAFAKLRFRGRERLLRGLLAALVIPGQVALPPLFLLMKALGLVDSYAGVLVPSLASVFAVLFIRQAALSIPDEMLDAARLDGASEARIFRTIVAPLLRPILVTLGLFVFLASWNDFLWPLIIVADERLYTLPVALAALSREYAYETELMMAGAVVTTLPVLLLFLALQGYYVRGVLDSGIKG